MRPLLLTLLMIACNGDNGDTLPPAEDCNACGADSYCLVFATSGDFDDWEERCETIPTECVAEPNCNCASELYGACPDETSAFACADGGGGPLYITCTL